MHEFHVQRGFGALHCYGLLGLWALLACPARAEDPQALQEVVVTAERREVSEEKVPIALTVFTAQDIAALNLQRSADVANQTPNLLIDSEYGVSGPRISLRGVTNNDFSPTANTPVTVYADGVVLNNVSSHGFAMFDLDRIEVLRGPQGTLYGRNATTGSLNFIAARPTSEFTSYADLTYGEYNQRRFAGAVGGPLVEGAVLGRLAVLANDIDGYIRNTVNGSMTPKTNDFAVRGMLQLKPTETLNILLKAQYASNRGESVIFGSDIDPNPLNGLPNPGPSSNWKSVTLGLTDRPENIDALDLMAQVDWTLGSVLLTSVTGYDTNRRYELNDDDASVGEFFWENFRHHQHQASQELRLTSQYDSAFQWIVGAFYLREGITSHQRFDFSGLFFDPNPADGYGSLTDIDQTLNSEAVFAHTTYALTDRLTATVAGRWTEDRKSINGLEIDCLLFDRTTTFFDQLVPSDPQCAPGGVGTQIRNDSWSKWTWRTALDYEASRDAHLYGSISRGFKGGGYNGVPTTHDSFSVVSPETLTAYEIGAKTQWLERRLGLNASAFYYDYVDYQVYALEYSASSISNILNVFTNAPKAHIYGGELELRALPIDHLMVNLNAGYVDARFVEFVEAGNLNHNGSRLPRTPSTFSGLVRYDATLPGGWVLSPQVDWSWRSSTFMDFSETVRVNGFWRPNARLSLHDSSNHYAVTVFAEGLDRRLHPVSRTEPTIGGAQTFTILGPPPTIGITLSAKF